MVSNLRFISILRFKNMAQIVLITTRKNSNACSIVLLRSTKTREAHRSHHRHLIVVFRFFVTLMLSSFLLLLSLLLSLRCALQLFLQVVILFLLLDFPLVFVESFFDLVQRASFDFHRHAEVPLMFLPIDVIEKIDRVLNYAVTYVAKVSSRLIRWLVLKGSKHEVLVIAESVQLTLLMTIDFPSLLSRSTLYSRVLRSSRASGRAGRKICFCYWFQGVNFRSKSNLLHPSWAFESDQEPCADTRQHSTSDDGHLVASTSLETQFTTIFLFRIFLCAVRLLSLMLGFASSLVFMFEPSLNQNRSLIWLELNIQRSKKYYKLTQIALKGLTQYPTQRYCWSIQTSPQFWQFFVYIFFIAVTKLYHESVRIWTWVGHRRASQEASGGVGASSSSRPARM